MKELSILKVYKAYHQQTNKNMFQQFKEDIYRYNFQEIVGNIQQVIKKYFKMLLSEEVIYKRNELKYKMGFI